jgi:hypothetical protein
MNININTKKNFFCRKLNYQSNPLFELKWINSIKLKQTIAGNIFKRIIKEKENFIKLVSIFLNSFFIPLRIGAFIVAAWIFIWNLYLGIFHFLTAGFNDFGCKLLNEQHDFK